MTEEKDSRLAKFYSLQSSGEWDTLYMGIITVSKNEPQEQSTINILDAEDKTTVLYTIPIKPSITYEKKEKSLIQWREDENQEFAISFLTFEHREYIKDQIDEICNTNSLEGLSQIAIDTGTNTSTNYLPDITMSTFPTICSNFAELALNSTWDLVDKLVMNDNAYFRQLLQFANDHILFEDLRPVHDLACGLNILITHCKRDFYYVVFSDEFYLDVFSVLDYLTPLYETQHNHLREDFETKVRYHKVIDFGNETLTELIHITFRLQYFRDTVALSIVNSLYGDSLSGVIQDNLNRITEEICENDRCSKAMLELLNPEEDLEEPVGLIYHLFLTQNSIPSLLCLPTLMKAFCGVDLKGELGDEFGVEVMDIPTPSTDLTILDQFEKVLQVNKQNTTTVLKIVLVIERICKLCTQYACSYFFNKQNPTGMRLMQCILQLLLHSEHYGIQTSAASILSILLAREIRMNMDDLIYVRVFYAEFMPALVQPLLEQPDTLSTDAQLLLLELIASFLCYHNSYIHSFFADGKLLTALIERFTTQSMLLRCAILQVFCVGVSLADGWFGKLMVDKKGVDCLVQAIKPETFQMRTLFDSKLLVFFNTALLKEHAYVLTYVAEAITGLQIHSLEPFKSIVDWVEKWKETEETEETIPSTLDRDERMKEQMDEEAYFDAVDDEEEAEPIEDVPVERVTIEAVKEEEPKEEEPVDADSLQSFFKTSKQKQTNSPMRMSLKLNLNSSTFDCDSKRPKLEYSVC